MKIAIAKNAGFCMGVRRAVEMALDASNRTFGPIYSYGPLIHNPQVLDVLEKKRVSVIEKAPGEASGTVIIRAHGVPPEERDALIRAGFDVLDATCPKVIKVQSIIARHARQGHAVIIIGDRTHPEVKGLLGYAGENGYVADSIAALNSLPVFDRAIIVAQTTQNTDLFRRVTAWAAAPGLSMDCALRARSRALSRTAWEAAQTPPGTRSRPAAPSRSVRRAWRRWPTT